jgi:NAD(P) transhydrogenase
VVEHERMVVRDQLRRNHVATIAGTAAFVDAHTVEVRDKLVSGASIVIAVGTTPTRPAGVDFDGRTVVDSDGLLRVERVPDTMTIVGAGVIGTEYASMAAALGIRVTVVDKRPLLLDFVDDETLRTRGGLIAVDAQFRTAQPHIFAVGDVIGFPSLAATSAEQGRLAALAAFDLESRPMCETFPYGIYTIPEISMVGRTEEELTHAGVGYVTGSARYREVARGEIAGDDHGLLKLLVNADSRRLEGVHIAGTAATELIHIGQVVMDAGLPVDYLVDAVLNYPTFADAYKVGALDAANRLSALDGSRRLLRRAS